MKIWFLLLLGVFFTLGLYYFTDASRSWWIFLSAWWGMCLVVATWLIFDCGKVNWNGDKKKK